jgi:hypothetical protein
MRNTKLIYSLQDGVNCAVDSAITLKDIFEFGLRLQQGQVQKSRATICKHLVRSDMLEQVMTICIRAFGMYCQYSDSRSSHPVDHVVAQMLIGGRGDPGYLRARDSLSRAKHTCAHCMLENVHQGPLQNRNQTPPVFHEETSEISDSVEIDDILDDIDEVVVPDATVCGQFTFSNPPEDLKKNIWLKGARLHPCLLSGRKQQVHAPQEWSLVLPSNFKPVAQELQWDFDDYDTGLTLEENQHYMAIADKATSDLDEELLLPTGNVWRKIIDTGVRKVPFSLHLFHMNPLDMEQVLNHFLSIGPENDQKWRDKTLEPITGNYSLSRKARTDIPKSAKISVKDAITLSFQEMLRLAGPLGSDQSISMFVKGKLGNQLIRVDPEKGATKVEPQDVSHDEDFDSLIYLSNVLKCFKCSLWVHQMPYLRDKAPISRNNHIYAELLPPRSNFDRKRNKAHRQEWKTRRVPLSAIPHVPFGTIGGSLARINVYIFWPRMLRQNKDGRYISLVPNAPQRLWLNNVLIPSINEIASEIPEYTNTLAELEYKKKGESNPQHQHPIRASDLDKLLLKLQHRIDKDRDNLSIFGSFFFCVDIRGVKNIIRDEADLNLLDVLKRELHMLDIEILKDRSIGECVIDIATIFRAKDDDGVCVSGLWKLDHVNASYDKAGFKSGKKIHHLCSLADYGSRQSEMGAERGRRVQIISRQTYHPIYELVKRPGKEPYTPTDAQAYSGAQDFQDDCINLVKQLQRGKDKHWGLRDETRLSLNGALELLKNNNLDNKVCLNLLVIFCPNIHA